MKKRFILIFTMIVTMHMFFSVQSVSASSRAIKEMQGYEIMVGDENGDFNPEKKVSRAEFCTIILRCHGLDRNFGFEYDNPFSDISEGHWAYNSINTLYGLGIIDGVDENIFNPEGTVTAEQAVKMLVMSLGYGLEAEKKGGYPNGYMSVATERGILKGMGISPDKELTREEIAVLIYNTLDVPMLVQDLNNNIQFNVDNDMTIRKILEDLKNRYKGKGIVTGSGNTFISGDDYENNIYVEIDGELYFSGGNDYSQYIGLEVNYYYDYDEDDGRPVIYTMIPTDKNTSMKIINEDIVSADIKNNSISYAREDGKTKNLSLSENVLYVFNGRFEYILDENAFNGYGNIRLVDNNDDRKYDYVFVNSYEVLVVDKLSTSQNILLLKNERKNGATSFVFSDDSDYIYNFVKDGEKCELGAISEDDIIIARMSLDGKYTTMEIISGEIIIGKLTSLSNDEHQLGIDNQIYEYADANSMRHIKELALGEKFKFYLDNEGRILYFEEDLSDKRPYCYYLDTFILDDMDSCLIKVIADNQVVKYNCAANIRIDGKKCNVQTIKSELNSGSVYKLSFNSKNEVINMESVEVSAIRGDRRYHIKYNSFKDVFCPFRMDENTVIYMIPTNQVVCDDDYLTSPDLKHNALLECEAYGVDEETQVAAAVAIYGAFSYEESGSIVKNSTASIVDGLRTVYNEEEGIVETLVDLYQYGNYITIPVKDNSVIEKEVKALKTGDVIFYSTNTLGKMDNIEIIATDIMSMEVQKNGFTDDTGWMKGYVSRCKKNWMKQNSNIVSNILYLSLDKSGVNEEAFVLETDVENQVDTPIYCIDQGLRTVYPITIDDIISVEDTREISDVAYVYSINSAAQVVVTIKE